MMTSFGKLVDRYSSLTTQKTNNSVEWQLEIILSVLFKLFSVVGTVSCHNKVEIKIFVTQN